MNFTKNGLAIIVFLTLVGTIANAQTNNFSSTVTLGVGVPILDGGIGGHIGFNPSLSISEYFAAEGQISYANIRVNSTFLSGKTGTIHSVNALVGPRLYFTAQDAKVRPYINFLIGGLYNSEVIDNIDSDSEFGFGYSGGAFVKINQFVLGLSYDTPQNLIFKVGYTF